MDSSFFQGPPLACLPDQATNAYCYVEAVRNNPEDLYFYTLPFGIALPNTTAPSCTACTKSVMSLYSQWQNLSALNEVYSDAARTANLACGSGFAVVTGAVSAAGPGFEASLGAWMLLLFGISWVLSW